MKKKLKARKLPTGSKPTSTPKVNTTTVAAPLRSIRTERPFPLPTPIKAALQKLHSAGHLSFVVGGSVRDFLLGRKSKDHDLATSATPDEVCALFPHSITVGRAFGVIKIPTQSEPPLVEIATFREDLAYSDHRHPKGVQFSHPSADAQRRDFTINGLFYDPKSSQILDYVGGLEDLKTKTLRAIGNPDQRFREDALRLLRAIRFEIQLGFKIEAATAAAIRARAKLILKISPERIRDELSAMFMGPRPDLALKSLSDHGLLVHVLPEVEAIRHLADGPSTLDKTRGRVRESWEHLLQTLRYLAENAPKRSLTLGWTAILHEIGRAVPLKEGQGLNFKGSEVIGAKLSMTVTARLKLPKADTETIGRMVADHLKFREVYQMREATLERFIRQEYFEELLQFHHADARAWDGNLAYYELCRHKLQTYQRTAGTEVKILDGRDLIQMGFSPGPLFSEILRVVEDLALEKKLQTKEEALEYVVKNFVR